jgi:hypothetical protein
VAGKNPDAPGVSPDMRDKNTVSRAGAMPRDADGNPVRKCSVSKCKRPALGEFKMCSKCRCYKREYEARQSKGAAAAREYCAKMWAPKGNQ